MLPVNVHNMRDYRRACELPEPWHAVSQVQYLQQQLQEMHRVRSELQREVKAAQAAAASARDSSAGLQRQVAQLEQDLQEPQASASDAAGALQQLMEVPRMSTALMSCCMSAGSSAS